MSIASVTAQTLFLMQNKSWYYSFEWAHQVCQKLCFPKRFSGQYHKFEFILYVRTLLMVSLKYMEIEHSLVHMQSTVVQHRILRRASTTQVVLQTLYWACEMWPVYLVRAHNILVNSSPWWLFWVNWFSNSLSQTWMSWWKLQTYGTNMKSTRSLHSPFLL